MPYERLFEKVDLEHTELAIVDETHKWNAAIKHVTMGVAVVPILVNRPEYDDNGRVLASSDLEKIDPADYVTDSGREGTFFMVMVDRLNNGDFKALTPCSDYYAAVPPSDIYRSLKDALGDSKAEPTYCYNSLNGGQQVLKVSVTDLDGISTEQEDGISMELVLRTSLDKSSNHVIDVRPVTSTGIPILFTDTKSHGYSFKIRHTTAAKTEIVNFNHAAASIANNWNDRIVPYVRFLADGELTQDEVSAMMDNILEDSKLPKATKESIKLAYKSRSVDVGSIDGEAFRAVATISSVIDTRDATPMARQRDAEAVSKAITRNVQRLFQKHDGGKKNAKNSLFPES